MILKFLRDHRGSILPTFALIVVPLLVSTGAVVDYTNAYDQRSLVQDALDSAALAAGKQVGVMTTEELEAEAEAFYLANIGTGKITNVPTIETEINGSTVDVNTTLHVPTYFLGLIGLDEFIFDLRAQVTIAMGTIEVAMVLDNSTSMCLSCNAEDQDDPTTKIGALKVAATNLAATLYGLGATSTKPDPVKIAIAPFAGSVNVGPGATWVDKLGKATYAADAMEGESGGLSTALNPYSYFGTLKNADGTDEVWEGCVEERPAPHDVDDEPPSLAANPTSDEAKTLFLPMFAPDEPDGWTCSTGTCSNSGSSSTDRRYNGAPTGNRSYNNYLPDVGSAAACGPDVTMTLASPAVFTSTAHGLTGGTEIQFQTTGSLYTGLSTSTLYYVSAAPAPTTNNFYLTTVSTPPTVSVSGSSSETFTVTSANPAVFTRSSHGLTAGTAIRLSTTGDMYDPLNNNGVYYVISSGLSSSNFRVSTTSGGSAVSTSGGGTQSGTHTYRREALFTRSSHGLSVGNPVAFTTTGTLPSGITANTIYFVRTVPSSSTFTVAATSGGAPIFITTAGSGTHTLHRLVATSGTQSGTHTYTKIADWTCQSGSANCGGGSNGKSENAALAGINVSNDLQCKYGTVASKATIAGITISSMEGGPNYMCTSQAVTPLTTNDMAGADTVRTAIEAQQAYGYTNITAGIMWGWRLLSPTEPFTEGRAYTDNENDKIMIVMTDGENTYFPYVPGSSPNSYNNKFVKSAYGAWGYIYKSHLGINTTTSATIFSTLNSRTALACENVKDANIQVYTIAFQVSDAATLQMLEDCASDPTMAYQSGNNDELIAAFAAIGDDISLLRIAQ
jgi:Flp pilus assembly protein TadG